MNQELRKISPINSRILKDHSYESFSTESPAGDTLQYIRNHLFFKPNDLCIYKSIELVTTFIEILNPKRTNVIVGCIYWHPHMDLNEFNDYYLNNRIG